MRHTHRFAPRFVLLAVLFTTCLGHAEDTRLTIRTLAVGNGAMPVWHLATDGGTHTELKWPVEQPSPPIPATADRELSLFSKEIHAEGKEEFKVARKLVVPEAATEVLLVAWPVDDEGKVELMVVADGLKQAGSQDWLVINTSTQEVTLRYGANSEPIQLGPTESKPFRIDAEQGHGSAVLAQAKVKDEWKTIYSTYWAAPEKQRSLVLFYEKDKRVRLHRVVDILEPAE